MCIIFATLTWPENPVDAISEVLNFKLYFPGGGDMPPDPPKRACFHTLTFCTLSSTVYVALPVPEQLPYSGYALVHISLMPSSLSAYLHTLHPQFITLDIREGLPTHVLI